MSGSATTDGFRAAADNLARRAEAGAVNEAALLQRHYGLTGTIVPLSSEVERTAEVRLADGRALILKTATRPEAVDSFRFQSAAIAAVQGTPGVVVPQVLPTLDGGLMFAADGACGYLQTRLEGEPLHRRPLTPDLAFRTGAALARLGQALTRADLPATRRPVLWNIACWPHLMGFAPHLPPGPLAGRVHAAMADFADRIAPRLADLDWQVTHNDPSPHNLSLIHI